MGERAKMDPEVKRLWVEALRSGKYKQGSGLLRSADDAYCCLGVLCELAVQNGVIDPPVTGGVFPDRYVYGAKGRTGYPPAEVMAWVGLPEDDESFTDRDPFTVDDRPLATLNDHYKWSFDRIADAVEAQL